MAIGPVQLIVLGFPQPDFRGEILAELERLRASDLVRVIDALAVHKDADGRVEVEHLTNLTRAEAIELGSTVAMLVGLRIEGEDDAARERSALEATADVFAIDEQDAWDVIGDIPNGSAAALILLEHHWAVPLRDAIVRAGGHRIDDGFIDPLDLAAVGLIAAEEARELHELEAASAAGPAGSA